MWYCIQLYTAVVTIKVTTTPELINHTTITISLCYRLALDQKSFVWQVLKKLSYRKHIARKLRIEYVDGINSNPVTLNLGYGSLKFIGNGTIEFELFDVEYYRNLKMWVRGHWRWLKMVPFESMGTLSYSHFIVTMAVSLAISEIFSVKEWPDLEIWDPGCSRSLKMMPFDSTIYDFLLVGRCNYRCLALSCTTFELFDGKWYRDLEIWVRGHLRSFKPVPFKSSGAVSYSPSIVTMALCWIVCEI